MKKIILYLFGKTKTFWATAIGKIVIIGTSCVMIGATATGIGVSVNNNSINSKSITISESNFLPSTKNIPWKNLIPAIPKVIKNKEFKGPFKLSNSLNSATINLNGLVINNGNTLKGKSLIVKLEQ